MIRYTSYVPYKDPERQREYVRQWVAKRRRLYLADKACVQCGSTDRLEVDHRDPEQKVSHRIWSWSEKRREAELAKCQILCYDCHLKKTVETRPIKADHGSYQMYHRWGCRCAICYAWKSAENAKRYR
jgi:5-methylcytosine-specific restriction endonuclease McrA